MWSTGDNYNEMNDAGAYAHMSPGEIANIQIEGGSQKMEAYGGGNSTETQRKADIYKELWERHKIGFLDARSKNKFDKMFFDLQKLHDKPKTFCTTFFNEYFKSIGYTQVLNEISRMPGKTFVEKALNYSKQNPGILTVTLSGSEAQKAANDPSKDVAAIGDYDFISSGVKYTTSHFGIVSPSGTTYANDKAQAYTVSGTDLKGSPKGKPEGTNGKGPLIANAGDVNGFVSFTWAFNSWAFNDTTSGQIQSVTRPNGDGIGGIVFIIFSTENIFSPTPGPTP